VILHDYGYCQNGLGLLVTFTATSFANILLHIYTIYYTMCLRDSFIFFEVSGFLEMLSLHFLRFAFMLAEEDALYLTPSLQNAHHYFIVFASFSQRF